MVSSFKCNSAQVRTHGHELLAMLVPFFGDEARTGRIGNGWDSLAHGYRMCGGYCTEAKRADTFLPLAVILHKLTVNATTEDWVADYISETGACMYARGSFGRRPKLGGLMTAASGGMGVGMVVDVHGGN